MVEQFETALRVNCAGAPTVKNKDSRRKLCHSHIITTLPSWMGNSHSNVKHGELRTRIGPLGWQRMKTLNQYTWLCPSCVNFVTKKRNEVKKIWGIGHT